MKKILIIEDNNDVRENLKEILELSNYVVTEAANGKIGVEKAFSDLPDMILCDIMMPELDGYGVLHIISRDRRSAWQLWGRHRRSVEHRPLIGRARHAQVRQLRIRDGRSVFHPQRWAEPQRGHPYGAHER